MKVAKTVGRVFVEAKYFPRLKKADQVNQLIVRPYLVSDVSRSSNPRQPSTHVFLESNYRRGKRLIEGCVHTGRERMERTTPADLKNVQMIRVEQYHD